MGQIHTARTLATRWHCTPATIYNLRAKGELIGFKLGALWRIRSEEVEAYECRITDLDGSRGDGLSDGKKAGNTSDGVLSQTMRLKRELHSETSQENVTRLHGRRGE